MTGSVHPKLPERQIHGSECTRLLYARQIALSDPSGYRGTDPLSFTDAGSAGEKETFAFVKNEVLKGNVPYERESLIRRIQELAPEEKYKGKSTECLLLT